MILLFIHLKRLFRVSFFFLLSFFDISFLEKYRTFFMFKQWCPCKCVFAWICMNVSSWRFGSLLYSLFFYINNRAQLNATSVYKTNNIFIFSQTDQPATGKREYGPLFIQRDEIKINCGCETLCMYAYTVYIIFSFFFFINYCG